MTAATAGGLERPPLTHTVKLEDDLGEKTIKMSYGLFNDLQRLCPDPSVLVDILAADPFTRDYIVRRCMMGTKKMIRDMEAELLPTEDCGLDDPTEIDGLLQWVAGHMLYFFATSAGGLKRLGEAFKGILTDAAQPAPSTTGSPS